MPKFNLDINGINEDAAEAREAWSGEYPPTGTYNGVLKILQTAKIGESSKNAGKDRLKIGVELVGTPGKKYDGFIAWGGVNLIDSGIPFVNQFLMALTDGSDEEFTKIKKAFYAGFVTDERRVHVTVIGRWAVNSPDGNLPIKISLTNKPRYVDATKETVQNVQINSFLVSDNATRTAGGSSSATEDIPEEVGMDLEEEDIESTEVEADAVTDESEIDALLEPAE